MLPKRRTSNAGKERSGLSVGERREYPAHRKWIRGFPCCVCHTAGNALMGRIECAHVRVGTRGGTSLKPHDAFCIPLCEYHHDMQHQSGERTFEATFAAAFPKGMKAKALEFAKQSPVAEVKDRAKLES